MEKDGEGTTRVTSCKKGYARWTGASGTTQTNTGENRSRGAPLGPRVQFVDEARNPSQDDGWVGSSSIIAQSPFCRPLCGHSLGRARNPRWSFGSGYT